MGNLTEKQLELRNFSTYPTMIKNADGVEKSCVLRQGTWYLHNPLSTETSTTPFCKNSEKISAREKTSFDPFINEKY